MMPPENDASGKRPSETGSDRRQLAYGPVGRPFQVSNDVIVIRKHTEPASTVIDYWEAKHHSYYSICMFGLFVFESLGRMDTGRSMVGGVLFGGCRLVIKD